MVAALGRARGFTPPPPLVTSAYHIPNMETRTENERLTCRILLGRRLVRVAGNIPLSRRLRTGYVLADHPAGRCPMKRLATIVLAVIAGVGIGWTAGHLGAVLGGAELAVVGV